MPEATSSPDCRRATNSGMPSKAATRTSPSRRAALMARSAPMAGWSVWTNRPRMSGIGGEHVLGEAGRSRRRCRTASAAGRRRWFDPALGERVTEALGAGLAVQAGLRDGDDADAAVLPALLLQRGGERLADAVGAVVVVGDDEGHVVAAVGADVGDHHRDLGLLGELQHARRGGAVGRREHDAGDAAGDRVLGVLELGLRRCWRSCSAWKP